ncbi:MAG: methionyl-tRNA formyltransferase [Phycisphaerales bacterium]
MRILFLGSGAFGVPSLAALAAPGSGHEVVAIVSQPDRPAGRGQGLTPTPVSAFALNHLPATPLIRAQDVNEPALTADLRARRADAWVVIAFGQKLSPPLLDGIPAVNLHASLLPRWRGAAPINAAILAGDAESGNTIITLAQRMDAGLMLGHTTRAISPTVTAAELHDLLSGDGPGLLLSVLSRLVREPAATFGQPQDEALVTKARKLSRADARIDLTLLAPAARARINGLSPWPGVDAVLAGIPLRLLRAGPSALATAAAPGTLIDQRAGTIACAGGGAIELLEVQPPGKKPMPWRAFVAGREIPAGAMVAPAN